MTTAVTVHDYMLFHLFLMEIQELGPVAKPILQQWKLRLREIGYLPEVIQKILHFRCQSHCVDCLRAPLGSLPLLYPGNPLMSCHPPCILGTHFCPVTILMPWGPTLVPSPCLCPLDPLVSCHPPCALGRMKSMGPTMRCRF